MTTPNKLEIPDEVRRKHKMMAIAEFDARHNDWSVEKTIQYIIDRVELSRDEVMDYFRNNPNWQKRLELTEQQR